MRDLQFLQCLPIPRAAEHEARRRADDLDWRLAQRARTTTAANEPLVDNHHGWARHALAANGFGDAVVVEAPSAADLAGPAPATPPARTVTGPAAATPPARIVPGRAGPWQAIAGLAAAMRHALTAWRRHRAARATEVALHELDDRALRDLGLDPSEIRSVASEVAGLADPTRAHAMHALCHRLF
jgi:uncharacterized protein YjiS (DUF1127 family)